MSLLRRHWPAASAVLVALTHVGGVWAQQSANSAQAWSISSRLAVAGTLSERVTARSGGDASQAGSVSLTPGVKVVANTGSLSGFLDYAPSAVVRRGYVHSETVQHNLSAQARGELIDDRVFVDMMAAANRQVISAAGQQVVSSLQRANQTQTFTGRFSPYYKTRLPGDVEVVARYAAQGVMTSSKSLADTLNQSTTLSVSQRFAGAATWSIDASQQRTLFNGPQRDTSGQSLNGRLNYAFTPTLSAYVQAGQEESDVRSLDMKRYDTQGLGLSWQPDRLTRLSASTTRRFFGQAHDVALEQRFHQSVLRIADSRSLVQQPAAVATASLGTLNDLLDALFADLEPDPVARAKFVDDYLNSRGLSGDTVISRAFLTNAASVVRSQSLSWVVSWPRDTFSVILQQGRQAQLQGQLLTGADDLQQVSSSRSLGGTMTWGHRLTPRDALTLSVSRQRVRSQGLVTTSNGSETFALSYTSKLTRQISGGLTIQRARSLSSVLPYAENMVMGNVLVVF